MSLTKPGDIIREIRLRMGLTGLLMSEKIGYSANYLSEVERGVLAAPSNLIREVCKVSGITNSDFWAMVNNPAKKVPLRKKDIPPAKTDISEEKMNKLIREEEKRVWRFHD